MDNSSLSNQKRTKESDYLSNIIKMIISIKKNNFETKSPEE